MKIEMKRNEKDMCIYLCALNSILLFYKFLKENE